ncbi:MAG: alpha/beta hydrolase [Planctomycetota bacterium]
MKSFTKPRIVASLLFLGLVSLPALAQDSNGGRAYQLRQDLSYRDGDDLTEYMRERCKLDVYHPADKKAFSTIVWFHGGGLKAGKKSIPDPLKKQGIAVVAVNYRLHPQVTAPTYIEDAAAAVAWTFKNIERFGGSSDRIFVSGHSAGGYLTSMVGLDKRWLAKHDVNADRIAGLIPYSGHTITHFTVRDERGISGKQPIVDDLAPLFHVRKDAPPLLLITGDREKELLGRYEENAYLWRMMQVVEHPNCQIFELDGYDHGGMAKPAHPLLLDFVKSIEESIDTQK